MIYNRGTSTDVQGLSTIDPSAARPGGEYIIEYSTPTFAYAFISEARMESIIRGWFNVRQYVNSDEPVLEITGVYINTDTGVVRLRCTVISVPEKEVLMGPDGQPIPIEASESGISPLGFLYICGGLLILMGVAGSFNAMFLVDNSNQNLAACGEPGIFAKISCFFGKSALLGTGALIGGVLVVGLVLYLVGKDAFRAAA